MFMTQLFLVQLYFHHEAVTRRDPPTSFVPTSLSIEGGITPKGSGKGRLRNKACTLAVAALIKNENHGLVEWMEVSVALDACTLLSYNSRFPARSRRQHYLGEGACHFYFLNNDETTSKTRETFLQLIHPYEIRGLVTHFHRPPNPALTSGRAFAWSMQMNAFSSTVHAAAKADNITEWMAVVDMDEYMYANSWNTTLAQYLERDVPDSIDQVFFHMHDVSANSVN
jgi:hypothetical protein